MIDGEGTTWLPDDASLVALLRARDGGAWAAGVAVGLADIVGRRRGRTFLANAVTGPLELDALMEAETAPGITSVLSGDLPVSAIARSAPRQSFAYLPAGSPALSLSRLREIPAFRSLLKRIAERGGTLLLYVAEEDFDDVAQSDPDLDLPVDGCIAIGDVEDPALLIGAPLLARVERPSSDPPEEQGLRPDVDTSKATLEDVEPPPIAPSDARASKHRVPAWIPWVGVAAGLLAAWLAWGSFGPGPEPGGTDGEAVDAAAAGAPAAGEPTTQPPEGSGPGLEDSAVEPTFSAPEVPYSVLVASFARPEDAERQLADFDQNATTYIVAPTPIRGRTYYRILAGALEDRIAAEALMRDLVEAGVKEQVRAWDVRPVRHSFLLGTYADRGEADRRVRQLDEAGIPAYVLENGSADSRLYRIYAGAYESEQAAIEFGRTLEAAGEAARLVTRKGMAL